MEELEYLNINGNLVSVNDNILKGNNRSFLYGDGIFESMHANASKIQFVDNHFARLIDSAQKLKYEIPPGFNIAYIKRETERMLHKNRYFKGARIRLNMYRNEGGLYTPAQNSVSWIILGSKLGKEKYSLNKKGLSIGIYDKILKPVNLFSNIKTSNSLLYVMAGLYKKENSFDDVLIVNETGNIVEALSSNIFVLIDNKVITPALSSGPVSGIMRKIIINILKLIGYDVEFKDVTEKILLSAEEVFLTNSVSGIQWVAGYNTKRYFNLLSNKLINELNRVAFNY